MELEIIPESEFQKLEYWKDGQLSDGEKRAVFRASQELAQALQGGTKLEQGRCLAALHELLVPHGLFENHIKYFHPHLSKKTLHRRLTDWKIATASLPPLFVKVVMESEIDLGELSEREIAGKYSAAVKKLGGIPKTDSKREMVSFINRMLDGYVVQRRHARYPEEGSIEEPPSAIVKGVFRLAHNRIQKLPANQRRLALKRLLEYLLGAFDFKRLDARAEDPPDDFKVG